MAAQGHFGNKSKTLVKDYSEALGFNYLSASNKSEFKQNIKNFTDSNLTDGPILFEIFTDYKDETDAIEKLQTLETNTSGKSKKLVKKILGKKGIQVIKKVLDK